MPSIARYRRLTHRGTRRGRTVIGLAVLIALGVLWWWTGSQRPAVPMLPLLAFVALCELAALGGMLLVRRSVHLASLEAHKESAGFVYATLGSAYAVLLSFMVVVGWTQYRDAEDTMTKEAITVATLFHLADGLAEPTQRELQQTLVEYNRTVLDEEWAAMDHGEESERAWSLSDKLWDIYMRAPAADQAQSAYQQSLSQVQQLYALRGQRLLSSHSALPSSIWAVLVAGAIVTVAFTYLFGVHSVIAQGVMTAALTAIIAGSLYLIFDLETPYSGPLHLKPTPYLTNQAFFDTRLPQ